MVLLVLCWFCVVACVSSKVVHQANGIVSIITELEPDRTPVAYLQAVDTSGRAPNLRPPDKPGRGHRGVDRPPELRDRGVPHVVQAEDIPLEEGQFRVKSAEIRFVNPDTRLAQQTSAPAEEKKQEEGQVASSQEDEHKNDPKAESASENKVVYPLKSAEDDETNRESRYRGDFPPNRDFERPRKQGKYGYQTPRDGDIRYDPNTRIRDDDRPTKIYKQGADRPSRRGDEFVTSKRKSGKAGHYVTYPPLSRPSYRGSSDKDRNQDLRDIRRDDLRNNNNNRQIKTEKDYSSKTVLKYPNGQAHEKERRVESSSKFKIENNENKKFNNPTDSRKNDRFRERTPFNNDKTDSDELHGASSFVDSSIENDDGSFEYIYSGKDFYGRNGFGNIGKSGLVGVGGGYRGDYGREKHFERAGGNDYVTARELAHAAKRERGHSDEGSYLNEQNEKHGHGNNKKYAEEEDSAKKSHLDQSSHYTSGQQASVGSKGADFHKNKGHRKGHKKSGFHSVVHKDEFNKKEEFYDEEHSSGEDKQQGHKSGQHFDKTGGHGKKEHLDSGHHDSHRGHEGGHDNGQRYQQQQRYYKDKGHSGHFGHEDEHEKRSGHKQGEVHEHSEFGRYR